MNKAAELIVNEAEKYSIIFATLDDGRKQIFREKLVELLVKECAYVIESYVNERIPASEYSQNLKGHFGVK